MVDRVVPPLKLHTVCCGKKMQKFLELSSHFDNFLSHLKEKHALVTCVPCVVAGGPGQVPGERERQVENPPGQNDDVVEVKQSHYHLGAVAKTCRI